MMTRQNLFDRVARHLLLQPEPSVHENDADCAYRGKGGLKCAVGCLIDDVHYSSELEGKLVTEYAVREAVERSLGQTLDYEQVWLLRSLQNVHDDFVVAAQMPFRLALFAEQHKLQWMGVEALTA